MTFPGAGRHEEDGTVVEVAEPICKCKITVDMKRSLYYNDFIVIPSAVPAGVVLCSSANISVFKN